VHLIFCLSRLNRQAIRHPSKFEKIVNCKKERKKGEKAIFLVGAPKWKRGRNKERMAF